MNYLMINIKYYSIYVYLKKIGSLPDGSLSIEKVIK